MPDNSSSKGIRTAERLSELLDRYRWVLQPELFNEYSRLFPRICNCTSLG